MIPYITSFLLGFTLATSPGPVFLTIMRQGLKDGFFSALLVSLGTLLADAILLFLSFLGFASIFQMSAFHIFLLIFGTILLWYLGIQNIRTSLSLPPINGKHASDQGHKGSFLIGLLLVLSNPLSYISWMGILAVISASQNVISGKEPLIFHIFSIILGIFLWDICLSKISDIGKTHLSQKFFLYFSKGSGIFLLSFGIYFGYKTISYIL
ncbi:LysE family transporter [Candidatus Peregrinibacteria bacterium]|nr:LysE family transporter [Candidatus Peregrinibacteria bacterium]